MRNDNGGIGLAVLLLCAGVFLVFVAFDACIDDESERQDLGQRVAWAQGLDRGHHYGGDHDDEGNGGGECKKAENCSDDDLSPRFDFEDSPVVICVPRCHEERT